MREASMEHRVRVWDKDYIVTTYRKSKTVWIASGDYEGHHISAQDSAQSTALKRWQEAATYKGN